MRLEPPGRAPVLAEIAAFRGGRAEAIAMGPLAGLTDGARAVLAPRPTLAVSDAWLGRVLDPMGEPMDGLPPPAPGATPRATHAPAPPAGRRARLGPRMALGVRALDLFTPVRQGQRLGLFAASGVGKSTLMAMLAGGVEADVIVFALVGERGRELREFLEDDLGPERLAKSVVICATSDTAAPVRREAAYAAMTVAEHFRDQGKQVLLLMDSVTRFALALREIGLAVREPPATRGYPPSVFTELPRLLERAGPGRMAAAAPSPRSSPCSSKATTMTSLWRMRCAASSMGMSCSTAASRKRGAIRRSTCCDRSRAPRRACWTRRNGRWWARRGASCPPGARCATWCASAPIAAGTIRWRTRRCASPRPSSRC